MGDVPRPRGVTILGLLVFVNALGLLFGSGFLILIVGIVGLLGAIAFGEALTSGDLLAAGVVLIFTATVVIIIGFIILLPVWLVIKWANAIWRGETRARLLLILSAIVVIPLNLLTLVTGRVYGFLNGGSQVETYVPAIIGIALSPAYLYYLTRPNVVAFFKQQQSKRGKRGRGSRRHIHP